MPFLIETLSALESQTYGSSEILVWDNGSTDGTLAELKKWIPSRLKGRIIVGEPRGVGGALAGLIEMADSEYCARIDADDIPLDGRLERQVAFLESHPDVAAVGSALRVIDESGHFTGRVISYPLTHEEIVAQMLDGHNPMGHPGVLFRRQAILDIGNYRELPNVEDFDLWMRLARRYRLANLDETLTNYRIHPRSCTQLAMRERRLQPLMAQVMKEHGPRLFGLCEKQMHHFVNRQTCFMLGLALDLTVPTWHEGCPRPYRSATFINVLRSRLRRRDVFSALALGYLDPRPQSIFRALRGILVGCLETLPIGNTQLRRLKSRWRSYEQAAWLKKLNGYSIRVHQDVQWTGRYFRDANLEIGRDCDIQSGVCIWLSEDPLVKPDLELGTRVFIGRGTYLGVHYPIRIGQNTIIGAYSYIISANHRFDSRELPIREQGFVGAPIVIGEDAWIGTHAVILPGVKIGRGAVIAAGAIVNCDVPEYEIWGGVPARFLKKRP